MVDSWFPAVGAFVVLAAFVWLRPHALDPLDTPPTQPQTTGEGIDVPKPEGLPSPLAVPLAEKTDNHSGLHSPPTQPQATGEDIGVPKLEGLPSRLAAPLAEKTDSHSGLHSPPIEPQATGEGIGAPKPEGLSNLLAAPLAEKIDSHSRLHSPPSNVLGKLTIPTRTRREVRIRPLPLPPRRPSPQKSSLDSLSDSDAFEDIVRLGKSSTRVSHKVRHRNTGALYVRKSMAARGLPIHNIDKELKRMKEVRHPNIVKCFLVESGVEVTVIMEFCEGGNLESARKTIQDRGAVVEEKVVGRIAEGILQGLAHLHGMNILHRDIKPTNILFSGQGVVKLSEFAVAGDSVGAIGDTFMGSLVYTAPERISGSGYSVGVDIWAMGISLLEFVHQECPYPPDLTPIEMLLRIRNGEPPRLKDCEGVIWSEGMKIFFDTVLRVDPETRPNTHALLGHPWIASVMKQEVDVKRWI